MATLFLIFCLCITYVSVDLILNKNSDLFFNIFSSQKINFVDGVFATLAAGNLRNIFMMHIKNPFCRICRIGGFVLKFKIEILINFEFTVSSFILNRFLKIYRLYSTNEWNKSGIPYRVNGICSWLI